MERKIAEINALMRKIGSGELTGIVIETETSIKGEDIPKEVRSAVARAMYGVLEATRNELQEKFYAEQTRKDIEAYRELLLLNADGDITISDGERTATVPGQLGIDTVRTVKERAATLKTSAEAALDYDGDDLPW